MSNGKTDDAAKSVEQGFSENELEDIMAEFETLDNDIASEEEVIASVEEVVEPVQDETPNVEDIVSVTVNENAGALDQVIAEAEEQDVVVESIIDGFNEDEMTAIMRDLEEIEPVSQEASSESVIQMTPKAVESHSASSSPVEFSANGDMSLSLQVTIAGESAKLNVSDGKFSLSMNGVDISIDEEGCKAIIDGGVNFNIPLQSSNIKKVA